jgi:glycosyltransferase involved in cell wall biosynthesis
MNSTLPITTENGFASEKLRDTSLVSVVIPTYNRTLVTIAAIESVLAQTYPSFEIIVVDDGSIDGSSDVIEEFIRRKTTESHQVVLVRQPNQGASVARNTGIENSRGEYIAFLDSDDIWAPEKLEWQVKALEQFKGESGVCVTDARLVNASGMDLGSFESAGRRYTQEIGIERSASKLLAESFCGYWMSTLLARADTIRKIGGFNRTISFVEDRDLQFRLSLITSIAYVNKPLIRTDRTPTAPGVTPRPWDKKEVQFRQQQLMLENWLKMGDSLPSDIRAIVKRSLGALHSHAANWHLENSRYSEARQAVSNAVRYKIAPGTVAKFALTWLAPVVARNIAPKTRPIGSGGHAS